MFSIRTTYPDRIYYRPDGVSPNSMAAHVLLGHPDGVDPDSLTHSVSSRRGVPTPCTRRRSPLRNIAHSTQLKSDFAGVSQLQNEGNYAAKWHSCAKKWFRSSKVISQMYRSFKMKGTMLKMALVCQKLVSQLRNTLPNGVSAAKFSLSFARLSSNDHNFFDSTPNCAPFEALNL
ncbi:hypothetical protein VitviT2T_026694 [Vitis vinifera]|uniref:Uncharacterized protein n=1 Tax=Vitis vinifera TaxID=29760 RepID=A0ABY9DQX4_VITVI|nr:hypothetical protein VitviT2T_026694 [Vitis vinifera]